MYMKVPENLKGIILMGVFPFFTNYIWTQTGSMSILARTHQSIVGCSTSEILQIPACIIAGK